MHLRLDYNNDSVLICTNSIYSFPLLLFTLKVCICKHIIYVVPMSLCVWMKSAAEELSLSSSFGFAVRVAGSVCLVLPRGHCSSPANRQTVTLVLTAYMNITLNTRASQGRHDLFCQAFTDHEGMCPDLNHSCSCDSPQHACKIGMYFEFISRAKIYI